MTTIQEKIEEFEEEMRTNLNLIDINTEPVRENIKFFLTTALTEARQEGRKEERKYFIKCFLVALKIHPKPTPLSILESIITAKEKEKFLEEARNLK